MPKAHKFNLELVKQMYYSENKRLDEVALHYGCPIDTLYRFFRRNNLILVKQKSPPCNIQDCKNTGWYIQNTKVLCFKHHTQIKKFGKIILSSPKCYICGKKGYSRFKDGELYCKRHYSQLWTYGVIFTKTNHDPQDIIMYTTYAEVILRNPQYEEKCRVLIDLKDVNKIKGYRLNLSMKGYVLCMNKTGKIFLHRLLLNPHNKDILVDHINHNKLDNRRQNLRYCTNQQNLFNRKEPKSNTSGMMGVSYFGRDNNWRARITLNQKEIHLGYFPTKEAAIKARIEAENKYWGEFAPKRGEIVG